MSVKMRQEVERKIATAFVQSALLAGYTVSVDNGDSATGKLHNLKAILAAMFQTDEDRLHIYNPRRISAVLLSGQTRQPSNQYVGWVYFVYGNDGYDVISDYTVTLEPIMGAANKISDHYSD